MTKLLFSFAVLQIGDLLCQTFFCLFLGIMDPSQMVTEGAGKADLPFISDLRQMELSRALFT